MAKKIKFQPYGQWILLPNPAKTVTDSGIILDEKLVAEYQILGKL